MEYGPTGFFSTRTSAATAKRRGSETLNGRAKLNRAWPVKPLYLACGLLSNPVPLFARTWWLSRLSTRRGSTQAYLYHSFGCEHRLALVPSFQHTRKAGVVLQHSLCIAYLLCILLR